MKKVVNLLLIAAVFSPLFAFAELAQQTGNHLGDSRLLEYRIEYLAPQGETLVSEGGIDFVPFSGTAVHDETVLPGKYFGSYPLYFSGITMRFRVYVKNSGRRTYRNLLILARQELLDVSGETGEPISETEPATWFVEELKSGTEIVLEGSFTIPVGGQSGLDQTHLQIIHWDQSAEKERDVAGGRIIVNDPQAGIWCPVAGQVVGGR